MVMHVCRIDPLDTASPTTGHPGKNLRQDREKLQREIQAKIGKKVKNMKNDFLMDIYSMNPSLSKFKYN